MNAICLLIDRLHAGYLGAYGNTWVETPELDRLAAEGFLFEQFLIDTPRPDEICRSYWQGWHALLPSDASDSGGQALPTRLRELGVRATLMTDEPIAARHPMAAAFDQVIATDCPGASRIADSMDRTHLAEFFARAVDQIDAAREPFLFCCHLQGLGAAWDAPLEFRAAYVDEGDPEPTDSAEVPSWTLGEDEDPDRLLAVSQAYAGQVSLLDACVGGLLEFLRTSPAGKETLLVLASTRGIPLGEHRQVGPAHEALYGELVHVPLILRFPDASGATLRSQALVQPADVWATLLEWWALDDLSGNPGPRGPAGSPGPASLMPLISGQAASLRDRAAVVGHDRRRGLRTAAWYLRDGPRAELYAKPDDRWEVNDVADRHPDVVDLLRNALVELDSAMKSGTTADLPPLAEILTSGLD
jgi:arylsulfatase A-like enzyme